MAEQYNDANYTIVELEGAFHEYFKAKQRFLRIAKRYCEQNKVDEGQEIELIPAPERQHG